MNRLFFEIFDENVEIWRIWLIFGKDFKAIWSCTARMPERRKGRRQTKEDAGCESVCFLILTVFWCDSEWRLFCQIREWLTKEYRITMPDGDCMRYIGGQR